jgi:hypothetical protein
VSSGAHSTSEDEKNHSNITMVSRAKKKVDHEAFLKVIFKQVLEFSIRKLKEGILIALRNLF